VRKKYNLETALFETTARCNFNCIFCGSDCKSELNPEELSVPEWRAIVDDLAGLGAKRIILSGGEPTLKEGVGDLAIHINSRGIQWGMVSNGFSIPQDFLRVMERCKPYAIGLSIDGKEETHNKLRGNSRSFQRVSESIKKFQEREIPISVITTVHKANFYELSAIASFILEKRIYGWQIQLAMPFGRMGERRELLLSQEEFFELCIFVETVRKFMPFVNIAAADCFAWASARKIRDGRWPGCGGGVDAVGIDSLGNVRGCLSMTGCEPESNIREKSLAEIWNDPNLFQYNRRFSRKNLSESCRQCDKVLVCKGGCNSQSFSMTGKFQQGIYCWYGSRKERREQSGNGL